MVSSIKFKGKDIRFRIKGHGKTIVLLHGFLENSKIWSRFEDFLSNDYSVVSVDLPGFGKSDSIDMINTMDVMAEAVNKVLNSINVKQCLMAGHSMGGYVALSFAEMYPAKMGALVLFHSHAAADSPEAKVNRNRTIRIVEENHHDFILQFIPSLFSPGNEELYEKEIEKLHSQASKIPPANIIAALEGMKFRTGKEHVLKNAGFPVLFIIGKDDSRIPMELIMEQITLPKHSEILILEGTGHMGFIEARKQTMLAIKGLADRTL